MHAEYGAGEGGGGGGVQLSGACHSSVGAASSNKAGKKTQLLNRQ